MDEKFSMCRTVYKYRQEYFHNIWPNNWKNRKSKRVYYKIRFIHLHYVRNERGTWSVKSFCWGEKCPIKPDSRNNNANYDRFTLLTLLYSSFRHIMIQPSSHFGFCRYYIPWNFRVGTSSLRLSCVKIQVKSASLRKRVVSVKTRYLKTAWT